MQVSFPSQIQTYLRCGCTGSRNAGRAEEAVMFVLLNAVDQCSYLICFETYVRGEIRNPMLQKIRVYDIETLAPINES